MNAARVSRHMGRYVMPYLMVLITATAIVGVGTAISSLNLTQDLKNGLIRSCEVNGNPLRNAVREQIKNQLIQQKTFNYSKFFPSIPNRKLNQLIGTQIKQEHRELRSIPPVNCASLY